MKQPSIARIMKPLSFCLHACLLAWIAVPLCEAQQQQKQRSAIIRALDSDGDMIISKEEIAMAVQALNQLDMNKDGALSRDEYGPARTAPIPKVTAAPVARGKSGGKGGGPRDKVRRRDREFLEKLPEGETLPDTLKLYNVDRELVQANSIFDANKYTVVVGGCLTCPAYRSSYPEIEAAARDFGDKGVQFYFLFQTLTHPENWGYVQPGTIEERFMQLEHAKDLLQTKIPWLSDTMDNQMKQHFAMTPNSQFVFDAEGKIVHRDSWGRGSSLRASLEKLVGKPEKTTTIEELGLPSFEHQAKSEEDMLVKRLKVDGVAVPLRVESVGEKNSLEHLLSSEFSDTKHYVKLRPEADSALSQSGTGKLYLGFRPDQTQGVKWNNLAETPRYKVIAAEGVEVSPVSGEAAKLDIESDNEPREFLVDVKNWKPEQPITVQVQYVGCHKEIGWCTAVQQEFKVWLEHDRTSGMVAGRSHFPGGPNATNGGKGKGSKGGKGKGKGGKGASKGKGAEE